MPLAPLKIEYLNGKRCQLHELRKYIREKENLFDGY